MTDQDIVCSAARNGDIDTIKEALKREDLCLNSIALAAVEGGQLSIIELLITEINVAENIEILEDLDVLNTNYIVCSAAKHGHLDIVKALLNIGVSGEGVACEAAKYGCDHIVKYMSDNY